MASYVQIVGCDGSVLYEQRQGRVQFVGSGRLNVILGYDGLVVLRLNQFEYAVDPKIEILYDSKDPQFAIVLFLRKYPSGQYILKLNEHADSVFSCLNEKCYLKNRNINSAHKPNCMQISSSPALQEPSLILSTSKHIAKGIQYTGKLFSKGITAFSSFISKKVSPTVISEQATANYTEGVDKGQKAVKCVSEKVDSVKQFGNRVSKGFQQNIKAPIKTITQHKYYEPMKEGAGNILSGIAGAITTIGTEIGKGANRIMMKNNTDVSD